MIQPPGAIGQIAYIVNDLDAALNHWIEAMGIGPFFLIDSSTIENPEYYGKPSDLDITAALAYNGSMCIELIEQKNDSPSVYRDVMQSRGSGFHHWGVMTENFDEEVERYIKMDYSLAFSGSVSVGGRFAYMNSFEALGGMVELIDFTPSVKELFAGLQEASVDWDGKDSIRST